MRMHVNMKEETVLSRNDWVTEEALYVGFGAWTEVARWMGAATGLGTLRQTAHGVLVMAR